jgi:hypothetical protein
LRWGIIRANALMMDGAAEYRFSVGGRYSNHLPPYGNPFNTTFLRSIRYKDCNDWLWVADLDSPSMNQEVLYASKVFNTIATNLIGTAPVLKFSGSAGMHNMLRIRFPENWEEPRVMEALCNLSYNIYKLCEYDTDSGPLFGRFSKKKCERPFYDTSLYEPFRIVRGVSIHHKSELYSVTIDPRDDMFTNEAAPT